jgi:hypothetical protein
MNANPMLKFELPGDARCIAGQRSGIIQQFRKFWATSDLFGTFGSDSSQSGPTEPCLAIGFNLCRSESKLAPANAEPESNRTI